MHLEDSDDWVENDRTRRRRSDVQEKLYNFLNRSAQSLTRSSSQGGRVRRVKESLLQPLVTNGINSGLDIKSEAASRLPLSSNLGSLPGRSQGKHHSISSRTTNRPLSPKLTSRTPGFDTNTTSTAVRTSAAYSYNTPPQTPSSSKHRTSRPISPPSPTSPSSLRGSAAVDLLLKRPVSRPITPSNSSSSRKVFGLLHLTSPSKKTAIAKEEVEGVEKRRGSGQSHKYRQGSGSSNEPLIHSRTQTSESSPPRPSTSTGIGSSPQSLSRSSGAVVSGKVGHPSSSPTLVSRSQKQDGSPPSRNGTPKLDFLRPVTPRAASAQGDRTKGSGKEIGKAVGVDSERNTLHHPRARAPASFLGTVPILQRTPPTPKKDELRDTRASPRVDSFMSDSVPLPSPPPASRTTNGLALSTNGNKADRSPAFASLGQNGVIEKEKIRKEALGLGASIERSRSAPGVRGRMSPCLRIPSPKFLTRDRERSKSREREKGGENGRFIGGDRYKEKKRVTPESVGAPILRDQHTHAHNVHHHHHHHHPGHSQHGHTNGTANGHARTHAHIHSQAGGANQFGERTQGLKANKTSVTQLRRNALPSFDFERPGSRSSSNGQTESRGTRSDDEGSNANSGSKVENAGEQSRSRVGSGSKAPSPVPPLPTRIKSRSPPPPSRNRPLSPSSPPVASRTHMHTNLNSHTNVNNAHDDSALPRLNSSLTRRTSLTRVQRQGKTNMALPIFSFERPAPTPPPMYKPARDTGSGQYINTQTGLIMWASGKSESKQVNGFGVIPEETASLNSHAHSLTRLQGRTKAGDTYANGSATGAVSSKALEEAMAVLSQFKNALDDAGFSTLLKYVRRYDAQIIPLEGSSGLLARVQRLLETSAPRIDERRKRVLYDNFCRVVTLAT